MKPPDHFERTNRREFVKRSAAFALGAGVPMEMMVNPNAPKMSQAEFATLQERRRRELWSLLGDLPSDHKPAPPKLIKTEQHDGYTLERIELDLNGLEPVPALLLIPERRPTPAPGLLYIHWHGGMYDLGKEQLVRGVERTTRLRPGLRGKGYRDAGHR